MRFVLFALLLTASASAQSAADSTEAGTIAGVVTDAETGHPLIGANVYLPGLQRGAATDVYGSYTILGVPAGSHDVQISYPGYEDVRDHVQVGRRATTPLPVALVNGYPGPVYMCHAPWDYSMIQTGIYSARVVAHVRQPNVCYPDPEYRYTVSF
ncbi:hypothetical protein B1759_14200 [Rubrivirga sp. SAORIC476]|uniref:carboxypeptidase-like regulatory domain-containing protein n=1 Tax=Rubrivirga sp. SAORIC476 TaxID=1961794 RepID=UPI000BA9629F|nr:carboxypeptidase-like regulatory domain-containing protein [Rubrivirga sp. SAORIC476]PAP79472.1 hypothetical protein B1759_14200 [Rubrivirga sp. SAORIC476]